MAESDINVLYEDDGVLVIDKPSGMLVHEDGESKALTVVDWFLTRVPEAKGVGEPGKGRGGTLLERSGVVHRLDRETSGVMILAKTPEAYTHLKKQFHDRIAKKEYRAFVYGTMRDRWGTIDRPIGRSAKDFRLRSAQRGAKGTMREAVTNWELIGQSYTHAYLKLFPKTGRRHQIRVHLKAIDRPIVMDDLYAQKDLLASDDLGFNRLALHAHVLNIILPDGSDKHFISPLPQVFEEAAERLLDT